jgi:hypothetical protein
LKTLRAELDELKAKKPELLEFRVGQHEEQLKTLRSDVDELKEMKVKVDFIYDAVKNKWGE